MAEETEKTNVEPSEGRSAYLHFVQRLWRGRMAARRFVPTSVIAAVIYLGLHRLLNLFCLLTHGGQENVFLWSAPVLGRLSLLSMFQGVNILFIAYLATDFLVSFWARKQRRLVHACSYAFALFVMGMFQFSLFQLGVLVAADRRAIARDRQVRLTLTVQYGGDSVRGRPGKRSLERTWVRVRPDSSGGFACQMKGVQGILSGGQELSTHLRKHAASHRPEPACICLRFHPMVRWGQVVSVCKRAWRAGFQHVLLSVGKNRQVELVFNEWPMDPSWEDAPVFGGLVIQVRSEREETRESISYWPEGYADSADLDRAIFYETELGRFAVGDTGQLVEMLQVYGPRYGAVQNDGTTRPCLSVRVRAGLHVPFQDVLPILEAASTGQPSE